MSAGVGLSKIERLTSGCEGRHAPEARADDFEDFEKVSWVLPRRKKVDFRSPRPCGRCRTWFGGDGKVSIERWYLSPYVEKPFNWKVIKSFVLELRSRECFSCFVIPMFYVYMLWTFYARFTYPYHGYVTHTHIYIYVCMRRIWH